MSLFDLNDADFDELCADAEDENDLNELRLETTLVHLPVDEPAVPYILSAEYAALPKGTAVKPHPVSRLRWDSGRTRDWINGVA